MHTRTFLAAAFAIALIALPQGASAASRPTCSITVDSPRGEATTKKSMDILALRGETLELSWKSKDAKTARDADRDTIERSGTEEIKVKGNETIALTFMNGSRKATCSVSILVAGADFSGSTLSTNDTTPSLKGTAEGVKAVRLLVETPSGKRVYLGKESRVRKDEWNTTLKKKLKAGEYTLSILGPKKYELAMLASTTLTILDKDHASGGSVSVSQLPLLTGGVASNGGSVPVAYVQIRNTGKTNATLSGITLKENGSAPDEAVIGFAISDDKGGSRATHMISFKKGVVTVPVSYVLAPGELRIFTLKALISPAKRLYGNAELKIDIAGVDAGGTASGSFPIRGTTWILR